MNNAKTRGLGQFVLFLHKQPHFPTEISPCQWISRVTFTFVLNEPTAPITHCWHTVYTMLRAGVLPNSSSRWSSGTTYDYTLFNPTLRTLARLYTMFLKLLWLIVNNLWLFTAVHAAVDVFNLPHKRLPDKDYNNQETSETAEKRDACDRPSMWQCFYT